ncbi:MAG: hypothetical protein LBJ90_01160 [Treponema sp.]|jgi:hypothetical protein|nr:hypothetical protein [Treponema sp.]
MKKFLTQMAGFRGTAAFFAVAALVFVLAACPNPSGDDNDSAEDKTAAADFREDYTDILTKTPETVSLGDEDAVDAALEAYSGLSEGAQALLSEEYGKLTDLKEKIEALKLEALPVTYTVTANGGEGITTTALVFAFSRPVTGLTAEDITITPEGYVTKGALTESGEGWSLAVTVNTAGSVTVSITKAGIESGGKQVTVYKEPPPALTGTVAVTGTAQVGLSLTADTDDLGGAGEISYRWQRADSETGDFADIEDANTSTYTLAAADLGKFIRVTVSRAGNTGTVSSGPTAAVDLQLPRIIIGFNYGAISISGNNGSNTLFKNSAPGSLSLSAAGYTDVAWYIDGDATPEGTEASITLNASDYSASTHSVTFTGKRDGKLYSQVIPFTVRN